MNRPTVRRSLPFLAVYAAVVAAALLVAAILSVSLGSGGSRPLPPAIVIGGPPSASPTTGPTLSPPGAPGPPTSRGPTATPAPVVAPYPATVTHPTSGAGAAAGQPTTITVPRPIVQISTPPGHPAAAAPSPSDDPSKEPRDASTPAASAPSSGS